MNTYESPMAGIYGLKEGGKVPGYLGHCPELRFDFGKTYGQGTHEIYQARRGQGSNLNDLSPTMTDRERTQGVLYRGGESVTNRKGVIFTALPKSNGDNKYTQEMVPGYTGYIPRLSFKFGSTYTDECDVSLSEHFANLHRQGDREAEILQTLQSRPSVSAIRGDPEVKDHLNEYSTGLGSKTPRNGIYHPPPRGELNELPIPGYKGFIPRVRTTEIGLGSRYTDESKNGLDDFYAEQARRAAMLGILPGGRSREISINTNPNLSTFAEQYGSNGGVMSNRLERSKTMSAGGGDSLWLRSTARDVCDHKEHRFGGAGGGSQWKSPQKSVNFAI